MGRVNSARSGSINAKAVGQARANQTNHAKRPLSDAPGLHEPGPYPSARVRGDGPAEAGRAVTGVALTDIFTSAAHGYVVGSRVKFSALTGGAGITVGQTYYVIAANLTANTFQVSATPGGASIDTTTDLTAGTVTKQQYRMVGSFSQDGPEKTLPPTPGPR